MNKIKRSQDRLRTKKQNAGKANQLERYLDKKMHKLNKEIAKNIDDGPVGPHEQNSGESLAKPKKKMKIKQKRVNFYPSSNQDSEGDHKQHLVHGVSSRVNGRMPELPPRHPDSHARQAQQPIEMHSRRNDSSRRSMGFNSSVENYQRYYQEDRPDANLLKDLSQTQSRIEPEAFNHYDQYARGGETASPMPIQPEQQLQDPQSNIGGDQDYISRSRKHYDDYKETQQRQKKQKQVNQFFEPQFIKDNRPRQQTQDESSDEEDEQFQRIGFGVDDRGGQNKAQVRINYGMNWIAKPTKEGFLYFCIPGTNTYQWDFPKIYDAKTRQNKYLFISHWQKKRSNTEFGPKKYWQHSSNPNFKQNVKPHSQTYLIQAAIEGNLAFLELYTKFKGDLAVCDQSGRSALIHAISNGHIQFVKMLCEFTQVFKYQLEDPATFTDLIELPDRHGNTPLFIAIRVNNPLVIDILISYSCNLLHRRKNGNTCLHECAIYSSIDCLTLLASYCEQDLFHVINKQGYRALDLALQQQGRGGGSSEITIALQKIERNLMYKNAVVDSDLAYTKQKQKRQSQGRRNDDWEPPVKRKAKTQRSARDPQTSRPRQRNDLYDDVSSLSSNSEIVRPKRESRRMKTTQRAKRSRGKHQYSDSSFERSRSQSSDRSCESYGRIRNLPQRYDHLQYDGGMRGKDEFDERRYMQHVRHQRKERRQKRLQEEYVPSFRKFREEIKQKRKDMVSQKQKEEDLEREYREMFADQERRAGRTRRSDVDKDYLPPARQDYTSSKVYYERMRHQKNHFAQAFGEESYLRPEDFGKAADKSKSKSRIIQDNHSRMLNYRRSGHEVPEEVGEQEELVREATRRMYSPEEEEPNRPSQTSHKSGMRRPHEGEMYNSRFVNNTAIGRSHNFTIDDIEKQRFRVPRHRGSGEPEVEYCDERQVDEMRPRRGRTAHSVRALRDQGYSIVEKAYKNTTSTLYTIGSYIYNGLSRVRDLINDPSYYYNSHTDGRTNPRRRAKSVHYQDSWMDQRRGQDLDYYERGRGRPRQLTYRRRSREYSSYSDEDHSEPSLDQYFTAHGNGRSQSRAASRARSRTLQRAPANVMDHPQYRNKYPVQRERYSSESSEEEDEQEHRDKIELFTPVTDQHDGSHKTQQQEEQIIVKDQKQSVSIQADSMIRKTKRKKVRTIKRSRIEASKHSIGVGSICIDDEINIEQTETVYETINVPKKPKLKQSQINNETVQSIASQKLEHSRMISFQRQRRTGKRLGKKAQQNLMESKHFQSSDEEKLQIQQSIKLSEQLEPAPHYLKQEVNYIKVKDAYEKQDVERISAQLKRMQELEEEQNNLLKMQQEKASAKSMQIIDNMENYDKALIKGQENEKKEPSTPTRQSTQMNRKSLEAQPNGSNIDKEIADSSKDKVDVGGVAQKKAGTNDIDDFYNQLLANNLSTTKIEGQDNDGELQKVLAQVQKLEQEKRKRDEDQESVLRQLYDGLEITEEQALSKQLDEIRKEKPGDNNDGGLAFEDDEESDIAFDFKECNDSLRQFQEQDTVTDLEAAGNQGKNQKQHQQKAEQFEYFGRYSDGKDSLDMALEGSWLKPVQNFGECLSDCTFILEEDKNARALYGSQMHSNVFDKGQFMNSMNNYSYYSQNFGNARKRSQSNVNLSMGVGQQILSGLNHNNSGFGFVTSGPSLLTPAAPNMIDDQKENELLKSSLKKPKLPNMPRRERALSTGGGAERYLDGSQMSNRDCLEASPILQSDEDKHFEQIDEEKFNKVIESNIKAIPKRRIPLHSRSMKGPLGRKRSGSMGRKVPMPEKAKEKSKKETDAKDQEKELEQALEPVQIKEQTRDKELEEEAPEEDQDAKNESSESLEPGAITRISEENVPPMVDQAVCDEKDIDDQNDDDEQVLADNHVEVARNYEDPCDSQAPSKQKEANIEVEEFPEPEARIEPPPLETVEEQSLETSQPILVLKNGRFASNTHLAQDKSSHSARRYEQEMDENSVLERSELSAKRGLKTFKSITGGETSVIEKSKINDQTNPDCTEIDFNLTQNLTQMNQTALNQTSVIKNSQLPPGGKNYTQIEQIDEEVNEGEASARRQADSFGPPSTIPEPKSHFPVEQIHFERSKVVENEEKEDQIKREESNTGSSPLKINDKTNLYGTFNPCSEPASSDADVPKLKPISSQALKCLLKKMPSYPSDLEPSKLQTHKVSSQLADPLQMMRGFDAQTISNSAKSPQEGPISQHDGNSILGKGASGSILGNLLAQRRPYTSEEESLQARNMRKWQSLKPPKEGGKNLRLRVSSASRSRGSSQNSPDKRSEKGSQKSKGSEPQKNADHLSLKNKNVSESGLIKVEPAVPVQPDSAQNSESKKNQLAEKLQKFKRPSIISSFQAPQQSRLNSTNISNRKSIRDVGFRNGNTSAHGFGAGASSILTDNSERLRENLENLRKSKQAKEARSLSKQQSDPRRKYRAQPIKDADK